MEIIGSITALATPFHDGRDLDLDAFARLLDAQLEGGTQALVVAGSTGEAHFLDKDEFVRLLGFAVKHVKGRVPVIAGTGEAGTHKTITTSRLARDLGADAALVVTPYYVRPDQEGLRAHFLDVADASGLPIILYNVPARTACDLLPATVAKLRDHPAIIGIKEAVSDPARVQAIAELVREDFVYLSGDDGTAHLAMLAGAAGTVSVVSNAVPGAFRGLCDAARAGDEDGCKSRVAAMAPLLDALGCAPNPVPVKAALAMLGIGDGSVRRPLQPLRDSAARASLHGAMRAFGTKV